MAYLLQDQFTTTASAPLSSPRTCEPGPGSLTLVQVDGQLSISGGKLNFPVQTTPTVGDQGMRETGGFSRTTGRTFLWTETLSTIGYHEMVWARSSTLSLSAGANCANGIESKQVANTWALFESASFFDLVDETISSATAYDHAIILRSAGALYLRRLSGGTWELMWPGSADTTATIYPVFGNYNAAGTMDDFRVIDLPAEYSTDYGAATSRSATPSSGATGTMTADGFVEFTWTPASAETVDLAIRSTDSNNRWIIRCSQSGSTIAIIEKNAGIETSRNSTSQTFTVGTAYRIVARAVGNKISTFVHTASSVSGAIKGSYSSATFNNTATGIAVSGFTTGANLIAWPRNPVAPNEASGTLLRHPGMDGGMQPMNGGMRG